MCTKLQQMTSLFLFLLCCWVIRGSAVRTRTHKFTSIGLKDRVFSVGVTLESPAASVVHCAFLCSGQQSCETFTFHQNTCRGHNIFVTPSTASIAASGARSYAAYWLYASCNETTDCTRANAKCYKGKCLCRPGYFYSVGKRSCVKTCGELQSTYTVYPGSGIDGRNVKVIYDTTEAVCKANCDADPKCLNYELTTASRCHTHHETATAESWSTDNEDWFENFFQRDCA